MSGARHISPKMIHDADRLFDEIQDEIIVQNQRL